MKFPSVLSLRFGLQTSGEMKEKDLKNGGEREKREEEETGRRGSDDSFPSLQN